MSGTIGRDENQYFPNTNVLISNRGQESSMKTFSITIGCILLLLFALAPAMAQEGPDEWESNDTMDLADKAIKEGAFDYILKPPNLEKLSSILKLLTMIKF